MARKFDIDAFVRNKGGGRYRKFFGSSLCLTVQGNSARWERFWRDPVTKKIKSAPVGPYKGPDGLGLQQARKKREADAVADRNGTAPGGRRIVVGKTFGEAVDEFIQFKSNLSNGDAWRGGADGKEAGAYRRTLKALWVTSVADIDTPAIGDKPACASRRRSIGRKRRATGAAITQRQRNSSRRVWPQHQRQSRIRHCHGPMHQLS